jgi:hypothetical protein
MQAAAQRTAGMMTRFSFFSECANSRQTMDGPNEVRSSFSFFAELRTSFSFFVEMSPAKASCTTDCHGTHLPNLQMSGRRLTMPFTCSMMLFFDTINPRRLGVNGTELSAPEFRDVLLLRCTTDDIRSSDHVVIGASKSLAFDMHLSAKQAVSLSFATKRYEMN